MWDVIGIVLLLLTVFWLGVLIGTVVGEDREREKKRHDKYDSK